MKPLIVLVVVSLTVASSSVAPECDPQLSTLRMVLINNKIEPMKITAIMTDMERIYGQSNPKSSQRRGPRNAVPISGIQAGSINAMTCIEALQSKMSAELIKMICQNELLSNNAANIVKPNTINIPGFVQKLPEGIVKNIIIAFYNFKPNAVNNLFDQYGNINSDNVKHLSKLIIDLASVHPSSEPGGYQNFGFHKNIGTGGLFENRVLLNKLVHPASESGGNQNFGFHKDVGTGGLFENRVLLNKLVQRPNNLIQKFLPQGNTGQHQNINLPHLVQNNLNNKNSMEPLLHVFQNNFESPEKKYVLSLSQAKQLQNSPEYINQISHRLPTDYLQIRPSVQPGHISSSQFGNLKPALGFLNIFPHTNRAQSILMTNKLNKGLNEKPVDLQKHLNFINNFNKPEHNQNSLGVIGQKPGGINGLQINQDTSGIIHGIDKSIWNKPDNLKPSIGSTLWNLIHLPGQNINTNINEGANKNTESFVELTYVFNLNPNAQSYVKYRYPVAKLNELFLRKPYLQQQPSNLYNELMLLAMISDISPDLKNYGKQDLIKLTSTYGQLMTPKIVEENVNAVENPVNQLQKVLCNNESHKNLESNQQNSANNNGGIWNIQEMLTPSHNVNSISVLMKPLYQTPISNWNSAASVSSGFQYPNYFLKPVPYAG